MLLLLFKTQQDKKGTGNRGNMSTLTVKDYKKALIPKQKRIRLKKLSKILRKMKSKKSRTGQKNLQKIWRKHYSLYNLLSDKGVGEQQKKQIIAGMNKQQVGGIGKLTKDFLHSPRNIRLDSVQKKKMSRDIKYIKKLADDSYPFLKKRRMLVQKGGFLNFLLPLATSVAGPLITGLGSKILGGLFKRK